MIENPRIIVQVGSDSKQKENFCKRIINQRKIKKVLIIDINNSYTEYPELTDPYFVSDPSKTGIFRYNIHNLRQDKPKHKKSKREKYMEICNKFQNGLLIMGDTQTLCNKFTPIPSDIYMPFIVSRTRNNHIIIGFDNFKQASHPKLLPNADVIIIHKSQESVPDKERYENYYDKVLDATLMNQFHEGYTAYDLNTNQLTMCDYATE